jgi:hypothetical protein
MITADQLLAAGYRAFKQDNAVADNLLYQKRIRDGEATLYFLNVTIWNFGKHFPDRVKTNSVQVSCETQLYPPESDQLVGSGGFKLELSLQDTATIEEMERFYDHAYRAMSCVPDLHNNDYDERFRIGG